MAAAINLTICLKFSIPSRIAEFSANAFKAPYYISSLPFPLKNYPSSILMLVGAVAESAGPFAS